MTMTDNQSTLNGTISVKVHSVAYIKTNILNVYFESACICYTRELTAWSKVIISQNETIQRLLRCAAVIGQQ